MYVAQELMRQHTMCIHAVQLLLVADGSCMCVWRRS